MRKKIHFIGIGGIGMSALAQWYHSEGWQVSGADAERSLITDALKKKGVHLTIGKKVSPWLKKDLAKVVFSAAVPEKHPERRLAKKLDLRQQSYAQALGALTKSHKTIAICGAHGKSTTTAMTALMLIEAGWDPTVIVGTRLKEFGNSNFRKGRSPWLVMEADEFHASFLNYHPYAVVSTNVDREHLDFYKTFSNVKKEFRKFFMNVKSGGWLVVNGDDPFLAKISTPRVHVTRYRLRDARAKRLKRLLRVPGKHNLSNALAVDALGKALGISEKVRDRALAKFKGTWRRFEFKGIFRGSRVYDDYGHHPAEIKATLQGAREMFPRSRIWCIFQPHHQERLRILFKYFTRAFQEADRVIIVETYKVKGREKGIKYKGKDAKALAESIGAVYAKDQVLAKKLIRKEVRKGDVVIVMGAGDIANLSRALISSRQK